MHGLKQMGWVAVALNTAARAICSARNIRACLRASTSLSASSDGLALAMGPLDARSAWVLREGKVKIVWCTRS